LFFAALCAPIAHAQNPQKPAAPQQPDAKPAAEAQKPAPVPERVADPEIIKKIVACLAAGLPKDWKLTWFVVTEINHNDTGSARQFEADFFFATNVKDKTGKPLKPCGPEPIIQAVGELNDYLPESQRRWTQATFIFAREGEFKVSYDYTPRKPGPPIKPAAKSAAKKAAKKEADSSSKQ
jgi:hypothetical protein